MCVYARHLASVTLVASGVVLAWLPSTRNLTAIRKSYIVKRFTMSSRDQVVSLQRHHRDGPSGHLYDSRFRHALGEQEALSEKEIAPSWR